MSEKNAPRLARFRDAHGCVAAIAVPGRTLLHLAFISDHGVVLRSVARVEERYLTDLPGKIDRAAKRMLSAGRRLGITKGARTLLEEVRCGR